MKLKKQKRRKLDIMTKSYIVWSTQFIQDLGAHRFKSDLIRGQLSSKISRSCQ